MTVSVYLPLALSIALAVLSPLAARRTPPAVATRVLTTTAVIAATASTWCLALLAASAAGWLPELPQDAHFSRSAWIQAAPTPLWAAVLAGLALLGATARAATAVLRRRRDTKRAESLAQANPDTELVVVAGRHPHAVAVPSRDGGRIVVTTAMLQLLSADERRVLFAHERSHLLRRHDRYRHLSALCAAFNPLLIRVRADVAYTCERWADEDASQACGDRNLAARALSRSAVAALGPLTGGPARGMAFERLDIHDRISALRADPPVTRLHVILGCVLVAAATAFAGSDATIAFGRFLASVVPAARELAGI